MTRDGFGEDALITGKPRNATVKMNTAGKLLSLSRKNFLELLASPVAEVAPEEAKEKLDQGYELIDVRYEEENDELRIPDGHLIPLNEIRQLFGRLDLKQNYVVYCRSGVRSSLATVLLNQKGFNAVSLKGGIQEWPYEKKGFLA